MEEQGHVAIVHQFGRTYRAFLATFEAQVGHAMPRWRILLALSEPGTQWSQKRLAEQVRIDPGSLTRQMKALEALGWIERSIDTRDNRITNVRLTQAGEGAFTESLPRRDAFLSETMGALPETALLALSDALGMLEARIAHVGKRGLAIADEAHPQPNARPAQRLAR